jgi:nitrite reductase (NADH) small subunit
MLSEGIVYDHKVTCPLHNWVISLEDGEAQGADEGSTACFETKVESGKVYINL